MTMSGAERKTVYVVRHGATPWNEQGRIMGQRDLDLSARGQRQAEGARSVLASHRLDLALTSPLTRTRRTAEIVVASRELKLEEEPRLIELALAGWEGLRRAELRGEPSWQRWITEPHLTATPEGETLDDVHRRAFAALDDGLKRVPEGGGLLIVTHGGVARVLLLHLLGLPLSAYHKNPLRPRLGERCRGHARYRARPVCCGSITSTENDREGFRR